MSEGNGSVAIIEGQYRVVEPMLGRGEAASHMAAYQDLVKELLDPSDYQTYRQNGKLEKFKKKSAWRKLRAAFGFNLELRDERIGHRHAKADAAVPCSRLTIEDEKDCGCPTVYAKYVVRAIHPQTGQFCDGVGVASLSEKNRVYTKPDHEIPATAYTRAANRAISDLIGAGEDSAEEVRGTQAVSGLPVEDRNAIKVAWNGAAQELRAIALAKLHEWGFKGDTVAAAFGDFNARAGEEAVSDLLAVLSGADLTFDPEAVEVVASAEPTEAIAPAVAK